jgi:hypothetical protein
MTSRFHPPLAWAMCIGPDEFATRDQRPVRRILLLWGVLLPTAPDEAKLSLIDSPKDEDCRQGGRQSPG